MKRGRKGTGGGLYRAFSLQPSAFSLQPSALSPQLPPPAAPCLLDLAHMDLAPYQVRLLGECLIDSPLDLPNSPHAGIAGYVSDSLRIGLSIEQQVGAPLEERASLEK